MELRAFFWNNRIIGKVHMNIRRALSSKNASKYFGVGNSGDIMAINVLSHFYKLPIINVKNEGNRLLCIGSITHDILKNDLLCGIGIKSADNVPSADLNCKIWGLRGPLSYEAFKKTGHYLNDLKFLADPGLLLRKFITTDVKAQVGKIIFIPHYRERYLYKSKLPKSIEVLDIDANPVTLGNKILEAEFILSSSLHGIIFAHSLGRPCKFVLPQTNEPILKFTDYFESVNIADPKPLKNIYEYTHACKATLPDNIDDKIAQIVFPEIDLLRKYNIVTEGNGI